VVPATRPTGKGVEVSVLDITWPKGLLSSLEGEENEDGKLEAQFIRDETELFAALGAVVEIDSCHKLSLMSGNKAFRSQKCSTEESATLSNRTARC
jgi:hypothetical protein